MLGDGNRLGRSATQWREGAGSTGSPWSARPAESDAFADRPAAGFNLAEYWRLALKHRILIGSVLAAAIVLGLAITLLTTPTYTATMTLQIDREAARILDEEGTEPQESMIQGEEFFQTQYGLLRSRSLAERVIESEGLASSDAFLEAMGVEAPEGSGVTAAQRAAARREEILKILEKNLDVVPVRGSRLVSVSFTSPDPALAARIANAFGENFIQSNLDRKYESSSYAREFLEDRIAQTKSTLEAAERQLVAYATQQQIINLNDGNGQEDGPSQSLVSRNLSSLNNALADATAERVAAQEKWRQVRSASLMSLPDVFQNSTIQRLAEERAKLNAQYEQNLKIYQGEYPQMVQLRAQIEELDGQISALSREIRDSVRTEYEIALNKERVLQANVNGLKSDALNLRDRSIQYNILQREVDTSRTLYDGLLQRYKVISVTAVVATNNVSVVDTAMPPTAPSGPKLLLNLAIAALLGLGFGILAAFILEALDESLATPEDVETKLGVPVLGAVPRLAKGEKPATALADPRSGFSEAYYSLRTALEFSTPHGAPRSLLVTSARPAEGKSTTAYSLAQSFARTGRRVLLVDGDLRNPSMHRAVGVDNETGMSNLLSGSATLKSIIHKTQSENLSFVACGPLPPNPAELWGGEGIRQFLAEAMAEFDHVVIDGPPVLGFADAPILAANMEGTVFVLESRGTRRGQARGALRRLHMGAAKLLGVVLTKFNPLATSYGGYNYSYDYDYGASEKTSQDRRKARKR